MDANQKKVVIEKARAEAGDDFARVIERLMDSGVRERVLQHMGMDVEVLPSGTIRVRKLDTAKN